jgi:S-formylglutathione hydrolase
MGGHGALTLALRHPGQWRSVSAFAPICAPSQCPWGEKAFTGYLGPDRAAWAEHDACELLRSRGPLPCQLLVDQGLDDKFLAEQLKPELMEAAAEATGQRLTLRRHAGYDHSYWFIQTFVADHVAHHAQALGAG